MTALDNHEKTDDIRRKIKKCVQKTCSVKTLKKRLPIVQWLPKYNSAQLIQDIIAGITVGLTAIPQGIAYAVVAGLSPEYGLYSGLLSGFVYAIFGSCKDVTVGPTAIMSAMVAKYVSSYSADFAVLVAFLSGAVELAMGILHLGFLVEFISMPVICGFTTAGAMQIAAGQLKSLFGLNGASGTFFAESIYNAVTNIKTAKLWDPILGFTTIGILIALKKLGEGCKRTDAFIQQLRWFISLSRNAIVVIIGMCVAYIIQVTTNSEPLVLTGVIGKGLPEFSLPPFTSTVGNETYYFTDMVQAVGPQVMVIPLVAILESVAIAKAFAGGTQVDATQEMIALGLCNLVGSCTRGMPITGSFTRTALNHASGVQTTVSGIITSLLLVCGLCLLTSTFYFIPKASLAGLIITAMFTMIDCSLLFRLWRNSKRELFVTFATILVCLCLGLEYGILVGVILDAVMFLYMSARPTVSATLVKNVKGDIILIPLSECLTYCAAEHVRRRILQASLKTATETAIIIDGTNLQRLDMTVASNLMSVVQDMEKNNRHFVFLNFNSDLKKMCLDIDFKASHRFVTSESTDYVNILP